MGVLKKSSKQSTTADLIYGTKSDGGGKAKKSSASASSRFLPGVMRKSKFYGKSSSATNPDEEPTTMKVAIVSKNRTPGTSGLGEGGSATPGTAAMTPPGANNTNTSATSSSFAGNMMSSVLDQMAPLMSCGPGMGGTAEEQNANDQMKKLHSGQRLGGEKFARAPVWGLAPSQSDSDDDGEDGGTYYSGRGGGDANESYDDIELVLQQTPERGGAGAGAGAGRPPSPVKTPDTTNDASIEPTGKKDLASAMEAEAKREREAVVNATREELLKKKQQTHRAKAGQQAGVTAAAAATTTAAAAAAAATRGSRAAVDTSTNANAVTSSQQSTDAAPRVATEDFVDASVASALETWRSATDPATGRTYYYNRVTKETKWDPPPELVDAYRSVVAKKAAMAAAKAGGGGGTAAAGAGTAAAAAGGGGGGVGADQQQQKEQPMTAERSAAAAAAAPIEHDISANRHHHQDPKKGVSIRKMLGTSIKKVKKGRAAGKKDSTAANNMDAAKADQGMNGVAVAAAVGAAVAGAAVVAAAAGTDGGDEMPDDEKSDLEVKEAGGDAVDMEGAKSRRSEPRASNVELVEGPDGKVMSSVERVTSVESQRSATIVKVETADADGASTSQEKKKGGSGMLKNPIKAVRSISYKASRSLKSKASADGSSPRRKTSKKKQPGWRSVVDQNTGKTYYYHTATKETRWDKPEDFEEEKDRPSPKKKKSSTKRAIWKATVDQNTGKTYYYHTKTKEVTWVKPEGYDEQEEMLRREKEEEKKKKAEAAALKRQRSAPDSPPRPGNTASSPGRNVSAFDPVNLELQKALATALPDEQENHDKLLEQYKGKEDNLLLALEELQEDTPFDECIEYDAVVAKMDQIEVRKPASNVLAIANDAANVAANGEGEMKGRDASAIGLDKRIYSTFTSATGVTGVTGATGMTAGTGMKSEMTARINNTTTKTSLGVPTIAEDAEDAETSLSSMEGNSPPREASDVADGAGLQQQSAIVKKRSQRSQQIGGSPSGQTGKTTSMNDYDSYAGDNDTDADDYSISDSVSALSTDIEFAGLRSRQARRKKKALGEAMEKKDWNKAASYANELSRVGRERSDDSNQKDKMYQKVKKGSSAKKASPSKEFNQSQLDKYISQNDWNSVAQYIAVMRSTSQEDRDHRRREIKASGTYDTSRVSHYSETSNGRGAHLPRKQVGARSQLQHEYLSDSSWDSESDSDSQASEASDWESLTSGPSYNNSRKR